MQDQWLIVAVSARFLAESAKRQGYTIVTIDGFADRDLQAMVECGVQLPFKVDGTENGFDELELLHAVDKIQKQYDLAGFVVGAGLDGRADLLSKLNAQLPLIGNRPDVFDLCGKRMAMHKLFEKLDIHGSLQADKTLPYLSKSDNSSGGGHIAWVQHGDKLTEPYFAGVTVSHLFLADGDDICSIAFNTQWHSKHDAQHPFCYGGAINRSDLDAQQKASMCNHAQRLSSHLNLRGLNCMDYVVCIDGLYCVELNPRPSATMQLNDESINGGLFSAHLNACKSQLPTKVKPTRVHAHNILYASHRLRIPQNMALSADTCDVPQANTIIEKGAPVYTLRESGQSTHQVLTNMQRKVRQGQKNCADYVV